MYHILLIISIIIIQASQNDFLYFYVFAFFVFRENNKRKKQPQTNFAGNDLDKLQSDIGIVKSLLLNQNQFPPIPEFPTTKMTNKVNGTANSDAKEKYNF